jgi:hypothetical protein
MEIANLRWNESRTIAISRNGDLWTEAYLVLDINLLQLLTPSPASGLNEAKVFWTDCLGHAAIVSASIESGNSEIDKVDGNWMEIMHETNSNVNIDVDELVLRSSSTAQLVDWSLNGNAQNTAGADITQLYIKLPFYFSKARSQALPTIALQYHDLRCKLQLRAQADLMVFTSDYQTLHATNDGTIINGYLMCNFAFLDTLERKLFATNAHESLITNIQISNFHQKTSGASQLSCKLVASHPTLAFFFYVLTDTNRDNNQYFNWECTPGRGDDVFTTARILFNGVERERPRGPLYFRVVVTAQYFNRTPRKNLYCYSFANYPTQWMPSGSVNLSRIDNTSVDFTFRTTDSNGTAYGAANVSIYILNFNIVRIQAGMMAKKYAN